MSSADSEQVNKMQTNTGDEGNTHLSQQESSDGSNQEITPSLLKSNIESTVSSSTDFDHYNFESQGSLSNQDNLPDSDIKPTISDEGKKKSRGEKGCKDLCQVCGNVAAGFHCGAFVCEACKKFYIRSLNLGIYDKFKCSGNNQCNLSKDNRSRCQHCRFQKCIELGMYRPGDNEKSAKLKINYNDIPCKVCGAPSSGYHFSAITCEGCKGFFRRVAREVQSMGPNNSQFKCSRSGSCEINRQTRSGCKYCRYWKCIEIGMTLDAIRMGRQPYAIKRATLMALADQEGAKPTSHESTPDPPQISHMENLSIKKEIVDSGYTAESASQAMSPKRPSDSESEQITSRRRSDENVDCSVRPLASHLHQPSPSQNQTVSLAETDDRAGYSGLDLFDSSRKDFGNNEQLWRGKDIPRSQSLDMFPSVHSVPSHPKHSFTAAESNPSPLYVKSANNPFQDNYNPFREQVDYNPYSHSPQESKHHSFNSLNTSSQFNPRHYQHSDPMRGHYTFDTTSVSTSVPSFTSPPHAHSHNKTPVSTQGHVHSGGQDKMPREVPAEFMNMVSPERLKSMPPEMLKMILPEMVKSMSPAVLQMLPREVLQVVLPDILTTMSPGMITKLPPDIVDMITPEMFNSLPTESHHGLPQQMFKNTSPVAINLKSSPANILESPKDRVDLMAHRQQKGVSPENIKMRPPGNIMSPEDMKIIPPGIMIPEDMKMRPPGSMMSPEDMKMRPPGSMMSPEDMKMRPPGNMMLPQDMQMRPPGNMMSPEDMKMRPPENMMSPENMKMGPLGMTKPKVDGNVMSPEMMKLMQPNMIQRVMSPEMMKFMQPEMVQQMLSPESMKSTPPEILQHIMSPEMMKSMPPEIIQQMMSPEKIKLMPPEMIQRMMSPEMMKFMPPEIVQQMLSPEMLNSMPPEMMKQMMSPEIMRSLPADMIQRMLTPEIMKQMPLGIMRQMMSPEMMKYLSPEMLQQLMSPSMLQAMPLEMVQQMMSSEMLKFMPRELLHRMMSPEIILQMPPEILQKMMSPEIIKMMPLDLLKRVVSPEVVKNLPRDMLQRMMSPEMLKNLPLELINSMISPEMLSVMPPEIIKKMVSPEMMKILPQEMLEKVMSPEMMKIIPVEIFQEAMSPEMLNIIPVEVLKKVMPPEMVDMVKMMPPEMMKMIPREMFEMMSSNMKQSSADSAAAPAPKVMDMMTNIMPPMVPPPDWGKSDKLPKIQSGKSLHAKRPHQGVDENQQSKAHRFDSNIDPLQLHEVINAIDISQMSPTEPPAKEEIDYDEIIRQTTDTYTNLRSWILERGTTHPACWSGSSNPSEVCKIIEKTVTVDAGKIARYIKKVPGFTALTIECQSILLRNISYPVVLMILSEALYDFEKKSYSFFQMDELSRDAILRVFPEFQCVVNHLHTVGILFHELKPTLQEAALLWGILCFTPDGPFPEDLKGNVDVNREHYVIALKHVTGAIGEYADKDRYESLTTAINILRHSMLEHTIASVMVHVRLPEVNMGQVWQELFLDYADDIGYKLAK